MMPDYMLKYKMKKTAVFIAAGSGMGADAAKHLSSKGFDIAIMSSSGKGEKLAKKIGWIWLYRLKLNH